MTKPESVEPAVVEEPKAVALEKFEIPPVITKADDYDRVFRYLASRYHVLTPVMAFSGMAPQHGLVVAKVLLDNDPAHGEVYQDRMFCKTGHKDPLDDEVAIAKVGFRKLAVAGGWNLSADVLVADRNYWVVRGYNRFVGLDGSVQSFAATEEYDLRPGSPQIRNMTERQVESARAHGLRGAESRALNAACREAGIKQKYTRRELLKAFVVMRMMFIPDASNELQMRIVTERALQGTSAMFPHSTTSSMEPIEGLRGTDSDVLDVPVVLTEPVESVPTLPDGYTLIQKVTVEQKHKRDKSGTFEKWTMTDMRGETYVTIKRDIGKALMACWNPQDWRAGRPIEVTAQQNDYRENELIDVNPLPLDTEPTDDTV